MKDPLISFLPYPFKFSLLLILLYFSLRSVRKLSRTRHSKVEHIRLVTTVKDTECVFRGRQEVTSETIMGFPVSLDDFTSTDGFLRLLKLGPMVMNDTTKKTVLGVGSKGMIHGW